MKTGYRADIDGLRAIAVLAVVAFHAAPGLAHGGFVGVDVFFVISGFLVSRIVFSRLETGSFSIKDFYDRRVRRIFPALLTVMISSFVFGWVALLADEYRELGKHLFGAAGFVSNFLFWSESGYFDSAADTKPLLHLWSLGIEEQFYIFWPLLLAFVWRLRGRFLFVMVLLGATSFSWSLINSAADSQAAFYSPVSRTWEFIAGGLLAWLSLYSPRCLSRFQDIQSGLGLALLFLGFLMIDSESPFPGYVVLLPTFGTLFLISAGPEGLVNRTLLQRRPLVWIGLISYPLYLWHWPMLSFAHVIDGGIPARGTRLLLIIASTVLAALTYHLVENPIRRRDGRSLKTRSLLGAMLIVGGLGASSFLNGGFPGRPAVQSSSLKGAVAAQFAGPRWQYSSNNICHERYPFEEAQHYSWWFCMLEEETEPSILLLGNSQANELYPGLSRHPLLAHHNVLSIGACSAARSPKIGGRPQDRTPCSGDRPRRQELFIDGIISQSGSLDLVIIDGISVRALGDPSYVTRLLERIDFIESVGVSVVVYVPSLSLGVDVRDCFSRPFRPGGADCSTTSEARERILAAFQPLRTEISRRPGVNIFDKNMLFCNPTVCSITREGMPLLRDQLHISEYGSGLLANHFVEWAMKQVPRVLEVPDSVQVNHRHEAAHLEPWPSDINHTGFGLAQESSRRDSS